MPAGWSDWRGLVQVREIGGPGTYHYFHPIVNIDGRVRDYRGRYQTTLLGRFSRELVTRYATGDRPFFLYLSALAPHSGAPVEPDDIDYVRRDDGTLSYFPTAARPAWIRGRANTLVTRSPGVPANGVAEADVSDKPPSVQTSPLNAAEIAAELRMTRQRAEALLVLDLEVARLLHTLRPPASSSTPWSCHLRQRLLPRRAPQAVGQEAPLRTLAPRPAGHHRPRCAARQPLRPGEDPGAPGGRGPRLVDW